METTRFPLDHASLFGVLQLIEVPDESHLVRGTPNGARFICVPGAAARVVALLRVFSRWSSIFCVVGLRRAARLTCLPRFGPAQLQFVDLHHSHHNLLISVASVNSRTIITYSSSKWC